MADKKLDALVVDVAKVKPLMFGEDYASRMILDHVITGRDGVIQINHGLITLPAAASFSTISYILPTRPTASFSVRP